MHEIYKYVESLEKIEMDFNIFKQEKCYKICVNVQVAYINTK